MGEPYLFAPEYNSMFSDNEFSLRAFRDGIVVDLRKEIAFLHDHPIFKNIPPAEWDEIYKRQNAPENYKQGYEVFAKRNPEFVKNLK